MEILPSAHHKFKLNFMHIFILKNMELHNNIPVVGILGHASLRISGYIIKPRFLFIKVVNFTLEIRLNVNIIRIKQNI